MSEIKTWQERCLERGIGSCEARDEELIELRAALAERDALKAERADLLSLALQAKRHHDKVVAELEMSKMKTYAASISPIAKERDELRAALAERDAKLAALETHNTMLRACLKGVIRVADRKTDEFDAARAALGEQS